MQTRLLCAPLALAAFLLADGFSLEAQVAHLDAVGAFSHSDSPALLQVLADSGHRVNGPDGEELVRIWLLTQPAALDDGVFIGVVSVSDSVHDARNRSVAAGTYSLRYVRIPPSREHRNCMSNPRFLVLMPLVTDTEAPERLSYGELVVSDRRHPLIWQVIESRNGSRPGIESRGRGQSILHLPWSVAQTSESIGILLNH